MKVVINLPKDKVSECNVFADKMIKAGKKGKRDNYLLGSLGEYAVGIYEKLPINFIVREGWGDNGADLPGIQVKTVSYNGLGNKQIKVKPYDRCLKNKTVKYIYLCYANINEKNKDGSINVSIIGKVSVDNFKIKRRVSDEYGKPLYLLDESNLDEKFL